MNSKVGVGIGGVVAGLIVSFALTAREPLRADQQSKVELSVGRWQIALVQKRMSSLDKSKPDINDTDTVLIDTQSGECWKRDLGPAGMYWSRMRKE
jgi:hypothetical protein